MVLSKRTPPNVFSKPTPPFPVTPLSLTLLRKVLTELHCDPQGKVVLLLDVAEAAEAMRLSESYVKALCKANALPSVKFGDRRLLPVHELMKVIERKLVAEGYYSEDESVCKRCGEPVSLVSR